MTDYPVYTGMKSAGPPILSRGAGFIAALVILPFYLLAGFAFAGWRSRTTGGMYTVFTARPNWNRRSR